MHKAYRAHGLKSLGKTRPCIKEKFKAYNGANGGLGALLLLWDAPFWFGSNAGAILEA